MKIIVLTSDKRNWLLNGFQYQWDKYGGGLDITAVGFTKPDFWKREFISLGDFSHYPVNRWSDQLIETLDVIQDEQILIMLEDYWLIRSINTKIVGYANKFMGLNPDVLRFCLTTDRLYCGEKNIINQVHLSDFDLFETKPTDYHLSFQASIFNKSVLRSILIREETPWQVELMGTQRAWGLRVFSTRQWPINYQIVVDKGEFKRDGNWMYPARQLSDNDYNELEKRGFCHE